MQSQVHNALQDHVVEYRGFKLVYRGWDRYMEYVVALPNGLFLHHYDLSTVQRAIDRRILEVETLKRKASASVGLREQVIEALVAKGIARHVAAERTNTRDKLEDQADALGLL